MTRRVVITGLGVISPLGTGKNILWDSLLKGFSGIGPVTRFDATGLPTRIAGEVNDFQPEDYLERKEARRMDRFTQFAVAAARMAVEDASLDLEREDRDRVAVVLGTGIGGIGTLEEQHRVFMEKGPGKVSPFFIPMMIANMGAGQISIQLGITGPNYTVVNACASGNNAIGDALRLIQHSGADVVITGGAEAAITHLTFTGFCAMKAMSTSNDEPKNASRPFDLRRDGFVLSEGAGVMVLEELEHARQRGAIIYAEVLGAGCTADAFHITAPDPEGRGGARAMAIALKDAGLKPADINYINAHGTSTDMNDRLETKAIKEVFGEHAAKLAISSTKSMLGHMLGAAGAVEAIVCALALTHQILPPTINYCEPDPDCDLDYVPNNKRETEVRFAVSNSFGFGGHNTALVFGSLEAVDDLGR